MKKQLCLAVLIALLADVRGWAQSQFNGTWKIDISKTQLPPIEMALQNGMYQCKSCSPVINVKADGEDHKDGRTPQSTTAVKLVDDHTVQLTSKDMGKVTGIVKYTVAAEGTTATQDVQSFAANGSTSTVKREYARISAGPSGAHSVSGSWRLAKVIDASSSATTATFKFEGGQFTRQSSLGNVYTAKLDGTEAPSGVNKVSLKLLEKNTIEETLRQPDGKIVQVTKMTISPNGKTITSVTENKLTGSTSTRILVKQ